MNHDDKTIRKILPMLADFKKFWKKHGPFKYALTSSEFPPILLEPEEWIFSNSSIALLKALMQWDKRKMKIVRAPFNRKKKNVLKPEMLSPWKIINFPEEWGGAVCNCFTPMGHLTEHVTSGIDEKQMQLIEDENVAIGKMESLFFQCMENEIDKIGYDFLRPEPLQDSEGGAFVRTYLDEWEKDEL